MGPDLPPLTRPHLGTFSAERRSDSQLKPPVRVVDVEEMSTNSSIPASTTDALAKLEQHVDVRPVLYATKFVRPEEKLRGSSTAAVARFAIDSAFKSASRAISTGIPTDGWMIVTPAGLHIFKKSLMGGVGKAVGTLTNDVIAGVSVAHGKKATQTQITITMIDQSFATVWVRTAETYPALSPWIRGVSSGAPSDGGVAERLAAVPEAPTFDPQELLGSIGGH